MTSFADPPNILGLGLNPPPGLLLLSKCTCTFPLTFPPVTKLEHDDAPQFKIKFQYQITSPMRASLHLRAHPRQQAPTKKTQRNMVDQCPIWLWGSRNKYLICGPTNLRKVHFVPWFWNVDVSSVRVTGLLQNHKEPTILSMYYLKIGKINNL